MIRPATLAVSTWWIPGFFKQDAGVGEWVDAMIRLEGPGVLALNALFRWDWEVETGRDLDTRRLKAEIPVRRLAGR